MRCLSLLIVALLLMSCGGPKPIVDYDSEANFSTFTTYNIFPDIQTNLSQLDEKRLYAAIDEAMKEEGFSKSRFPDLYINVYTLQYEDVNPNTIGIGFGGGGNVGVGVSGGIPIGKSRVNFLKLTLDIIDESSDNLIWQAVSEQKFNTNTSPEYRLNYFKKLISKMLKSYPPKE